MIVVVAIGVALGILLVPLLRDAGRMLGWLILGAVIWLAWSYSGICSPNCNDWLIH